MDRDRRTRPRSVKKKIWKHGAILSWQDRLGIKEHKQHKQLEFSVV